MAYLWLIGNTRAHPLQFSYCIIIQGTCMGYQTAVRIIEVRIIEVRIIEDVLYLQCSEKECLSVFLCFGHSSFTEISKTPLLFPSTYIRKKRAILVLECLPGRVNLTFCVCRRLFRQYFLHHKHESCSFLCA